MLRGNAGQATGILRLGGILLVHVRKKKRL